jgi:hypothetical protein
MNTSFEENFLNTLLENFIARSLVDGDMVGSKLGFFGIIGDCVGIVVLIDTFFQIL